MKVFKGLRGFKKPIKGSIVTIGVFDGFHLGHKKVIEKVVNEAKRLNLKSVVVTFDPHPLKVLHSSSSVPSLISLNHRIRLIDEMGVDYLVVLKFTKSIAGLSPERFVKDILVSKIGVMELYVGGDFYFGKGAKAGIAVLRKLASLYGFQICAVKPKRIGRDIISSSLIRKLITSGDIMKASKLLGRPVSVLGTVVSGASLARELGYPTANINPHHEAIPPAGVYAVLVKYQGRMLKGVLNIGLRPTFYSPRDEEPAIEVHIFDFRKNIYGKDIEVLFIKKIRNEARFRDRKALVARISGDARAARSILQRGSNV